VYRGQADVIVCDGFTGNVALKISEGLVEVIEGLLHIELSVITDYAEYGGAPLWASTASRLSATADRAPGPCAMESHGDRFAADSVIQRIEGESRHSRCLASDRVYFPGQGAHKVGMGRALADAYPICRETFEEADAALGEPLSRIIFDGPTIS
jgi:hypothetical protein